MKPRVFILSSGAGKDYRGFEAHAIDLFNNLREDDQFEFHLLHSGARIASSLKVASLHRHSWPARILGAIFKRNPYVIQNASFFIFLIPFLIRRRPEILYLSDPPLYGLLAKWRRFSKNSFRMIFHTGGNTIPQNMDHRDLLQCVTPETALLAKQRNVSENQIRWVPHFIQTKPGSDSIVKEALRKKLDLPLNALVILSVGALDKSVKRMDYLIQEVSQLKMPYFLVMLGEIERETEQVKELAQNKLPAKSFRISRVARALLDEYYRASDIFALASLSEGFGMASLEALASGLPVLLHPHPNAKYVIGELGFYADLRKAGNLKNLIESVAPTVNDSECRMRRELYAIKKYEWGNLKDAYLEMFVALSDKPVG